MTQQRIFILSDDALLKIEQRRILWSSWMFSDRTWTQRGLCNWCWPLIQTVCCDTMWFATKHFHNYYNIFFIYTIVSHRQKED